MANIIFNIVTGKRTKLSDVFWVARNVKGELQADKPDSPLLWLIDNTHPVFTSRGEYLGYICYRGFVEVT